MLHHQEYALANQFDYMVFRAQQELEVREAETPGILDGGLDQDYYVFTNLFFQKEYLTQDEHELCERTYHVLRASLPAPDLIIWMKAPVELIAERYNRRNRRLDITQIEDMQVIDKLLEKWLADFPSGEVFVIDAAAEDKGYSRVIPMVRDKIDSLA